MYDKKIIVYYIMLSTSQSLVLITLIFLFLFGISKFLTNNILKSQDSRVLIKNYMGIIYIVFGFLKLYDIDKFVNVFRKYDIIANKVELWAWLYPFIEILLGISLLSNIFVNKTMKITLVLMIISIISVSISLLKKQNLRCGCLGTFFHIPLSYVTISENVAMLALSLKYS